MGQTIASDGDSVSSSPNRAETIYLDLQRRILSGELKAGQRLAAERELAVEYATNRNTLREALRKLEHANLVTVRHGQGVTVADFRRKGSLALLPAFLEQGASVAERVNVLLDLLEARARMLEMVVARAATRSTPEDVARLKELAAEQVAGFDRGDLAAIARGDLAWVDALVDAAHSLPLRWTANPVIEFYRKILDRFPMIWISDAGYPGYLRGVMEAVSASDSAAAVSTMRAFFERTDQVLVGTLEQLLESETPQ